MGYAVAEGEASKDEASVLANPCLGWYSLCQDRGPTLRAGPVARSCRRGSSKMVVITWPLPSSPYQVESTELGPGAYGHTRSLQFLQRLLQVVQPEGEVVVPQLVHLQRLAWNDGLGLAQHDERGVGSVLPTEVHGSSLIRGAAAFDSVQVHLKPPAGRGRNRGLIPCPLLRWPGEKKL